MIACHCKAVSDKEIKKSCKRVTCKSGKCSVKDIQDECGACTDCKGCAPLIASLIKDSELENNKDD